MTTAWLTLCSTLFSGACFSILCLSDGKRYRRHEQPLVLRGGLRALLGWTSLLAPLLALIVIGANAALLCWLGALGLLGWTLGVWPVSTRELDTREKADAAP